MDFNWIRTTGSTPFQCLSSRFSFTHVPPTSPRTLIRLRKLAMNLGLKYVYVGNISDDEGNSTFCHNCSTLLIRRNGYQNEILELQDGKCKKCGIGIPGFSISQIIFFSWSHFQKTARLKAEYNYLTDLQYLYQIGRIKSSQTDCQIEYLTNTINIFTIILNISMSYRY